MASTTRGLPSFCQGLIRNKQRVSHGEPENCPDRNSIMDVEVPMSPNIESQKKADFNKTPKTAMDGANH